MKRHFLNMLSLGGALFALPLASFAQHGHLNAGATGQNQNDQLVFANAQDFITTSGYVKTLTNAVTGTYAGYFHGGLTPTALSLIDAGAPAPGAFIQMELQSVAGPEGGQFSFWESGATAPTFSIPSGQTAAHRFNLSEGDGAPGSDPGGHIHGRRWTATVPGIYKVRFRLLDVSTNGADGGPIHTPSEPLEVHFQAGVNFRTLTQGTGGIHLHFGAQNARTHQVERSLQLGPAADWRPVGAPVAGTDHFAEVIDDEPAPAGAFYRVTDTTAGATQP